MKLRLGRILSGFLVLVVVVLVLGQVVSQPILFGYVTSSSMAPSMNQGDVFIAVPTTIDDSIQEGDIVTFREESGQSREFTTHRVVDVTERGFITKGDANPFTDQDADEPPIQRQLVVAKALQVNGNVVTIPFLGALFEAIRSALASAFGLVGAAFGIRRAPRYPEITYLFFSATVLWYAVGEARDRASKNRERDISRTDGIEAQTLASVGVAALVLAATVAMVGPAGTTEFDLVSAEFESENPTVIPVGSTREVSLTISNGGLVPVFAFLEPASEGVTVDSEIKYIEARSASEVIVILQAPPETGHYPRYVTEHRYLAILPQSVLRALYQMHPLAPILAIDALIAVPFYVLTVRIIGRSRIRRDRSRDSTHTVLARVRVFLTDLY